VIRNFDALLKYDFFIGRESKSHINGAVVGSVKNHKFLSDILYQFDLQVDFEYQTGPEIITPLLANQDFDQVKNILLSYDYFYPYNPYDEDRNNVKQMFYSDITSNTYAIHHWQKSWHFSLLERFFKKVKRMFA
jgi:mannosyltransferase OCH1-like enzyme